MTRIREIRLNNNMTQEELAKHLNVKPPSVSKWENGKCNPSLSMAIRVADALHCSLDDLVGRTGTGRGCRPGA